MSDARRLSASLRPAYAGAGVQGTTSGPHSAGLTLFADGSDKPADEKPADSTETSASAGTEAPAPAENEAPASAEKEAPKASKAPKTGAHSKGAHSAGLSPAEKKRRRTKIAKIVGGTLAGALVAAYAGFGIYFNSHYGFNTQVNGEDVSFKTLEETTEILESQVDTYVLDIQTIDGGVEQIAGTDIALTYQPDDRASELLESQKPYAWPVRLFQSGDPIQIKPSVTLDEDLLRSAVDGLALMNPDNMVAPTDAHVGYDTALGQYVVMPEQWGSTVVPETVLSTVSDAIYGSEGSVDLKEHGCYVPPVVYQDDEGLHSIADKFNKFAASSITYELDDLGEEVLDGTTFVDWLVVNDEGEAELDPAKVEEFVAGMAERLDTAGTERTFINAYGEEATVSGGYYGWKLDQKAEAAQIKEDIESYSSVTREPCWTTTALSHTAPEWGDTYVEVSISSQHVWYYVDGEVVFETDCVTGLPTAKRATGRGVFEVLEKLSPTVLRGPKKEDGTYEWESPVTHWMRITWSGTGLHDANWRGSFGGNIYTYNGSHGCINLPVSKARELYGILEVGTPVIVY